MFENLIKLPSKLSLDFFTLPLIFLIGIIVSYEDFKEGKIKNKWILLGFLYGTFIYFIFFLLKILDVYSHFDFSRIFLLPSFSFFLKTLINAILSFIIGYLLWYFDIWAPGDAKLFFLFSLLLPLKYYWRTALPFFPSFVLLINTFVPLLIFLFLINFYFIAKQIFQISQTKVKIKKILINFKIKVRKNFINYLKISIGILIISLLFQIINSDIRKQFNQEDWKWISIFLIIFLLEKIFGKFLMKTLILFFLFLGLFFYSVIEWFIWHKRIILQFPVFFKNSVLFMVIFFIISKILSESSAHEKKNLPFAFWLLLGVIITMLLKGSILSFIFNPQQFLNLKP
jgi:hypothetical protein